MSLARRLAVAVIALVVASPAVRAQDAAIAPGPLPGPVLAAESSPAVPVTSGGPRLDAVRAGALAVEPSASLASPAPMRRADSRRSRSLMIIGGAALLGGAIIGDDAGTIIMLGGLGVGLYGLYLYLQ